MENSYNSVPIRYAYDRDQDNTPILKMITPNMLKVGHTNKRVLDGPIRLARGARELLEKVEEVYDSWFRIWQDTVVPKLLYQPKWFQGDKDLKEGDLVYFQKEENKVDSNWIIGRLEQVVRSARDNKIRRVVVKYQNAAENFTRLTDRSIRKMVKLFSIDEHEVQEDFIELQNRINTWQTEVVENDVEDPADNEQRPLEPDDDNLQLSEQEEKSDDEELGVFSQLPLLLSEN